MRISYDPRPLSVGGDEYEYVTDWLTLRIKGTANLREFIRGLDADKLAPRQIRELRMALEDMDAVRWGR